MSLKNKRILITAGPTWVPIDSVRVISNIASGETGILLAQKLSRIGAVVTLLLGPVPNNGACCLSRKIKLMHFKLFAELKNIVIKELRSKKYDVVVHSAAVSDFGPRRFFKGKINSARPLVLKLKPLPKIIKDIRRLAAGAKLVMFKLESGASDAVLISRAKEARDEIGADFIVANRLNPYRAFILDRKDNVVSAKTKNALADKLLHQFHFGGG